jgi:NitT/TauT family transport system substrate-binding protein
MEIGMNPSRRSALKALAALAAFPCVSLAWAAESGQPVIRVNIPGPRALAFLPVELIPALGIDRELGVQLSIRYFPSGVRAFEDALAGNAHFAGVGFVVLPVLASKGQKVLAVAPLSGKTPPFALVVRKDLAGKIRKVGDLKGRSIGVSAGSVASKTYLNMLAEVVLSSYGVKTSEVRWVPNAQNIDAIFGALAGQAVDAVFCEGGFISELVRRDAGRVLLDLNTPTAMARIPGLAHPRSVLAASADYVQENPQRTELMVQMVRRALVWMHAATPEAIVGKLGVTDENERRELIATLDKFPGMFSSDGRFSRKQVGETVNFLRAANVPLQADLDVHSLVAYQWSGNKP